MGHSGQVLVLGRLEKDAPQLSDELNDEGPHEGNHFCVSDKTGCLFRKLECAHR